MIIQELTRQECFEALGRARLGRLGCAHENQPYVVPVYVAFHAPSCGGCYLYGFTTPGQKVEWMRANPMVCFEWDEVVDYNRWTSVIAFGQYEELKTTPEWERELLRAHDLLQSYAMWWQPGSAAFAASAHRDPSEPFTPIFYRIRIDRLTGHRASEDRRELLPAVDARQSRHGLRGSVRGLFARFSRGPSHQEKSSCGNSY
jgi:nitroimidazol reductase NimA-like FMN-containing flavoprotein (pyridoxamine 5'-phosphate oxidase superfamily)